LECLLALFAALIAIPSDHYSAEDHERSHPKIRSREQCHLRSADGVVHERKRRGHAEDERNRNTTTLLGLSCHLFAAVFVRFCFAFIGFAPGRGMSAVGLTRINARIEPSVFNMDIVSGAGHSFSVTISRHRNAHPAGFANDVSAFLSPC
jgi:hypothetical protein